MSTSEKIWQDIQSIVDKASSDFRLTMNSNVHCMDVGISALKASDKDMTFAEKEKIHRLFRREFKPETSLEKAILECRDSKRSDRSFFVEDPKWGDYIIGPSYSALRSRITNALVNAKPETKFTGVGEDGKTTTNIGHLSLGDNQAATTPLESKLGDIFNKVQNVPITSSFIGKKLGELHKAHKADTSYSFNRKNFELGDFERILGTGTVLVTLQTSAKNAELAKIEARIEKQVRTYLTSETFKKQLMELHGSNTILEDIRAGLVAALSGTKLGAGSKHTKKPTKTSSKPLLGKTKATISKPAPLRDIGTGRFTSLAALQLLLDLHLQDVVSANMGDGSEKRILNYRTGRFAASTKVEKLTQSKEGLITAFYTYMKYPYATFSAGGAQQFPTTRDPKLLISKSIREIAATLVTNRMRSVLI